MDDLDLGTAPGLAALLRPFAWGYAGAARLWRGLRRPARVGTPPLTVGVGNRRVGGTGKTPVVADLAARFHAAGARVVVVSRGYRAEGGGDEPQWLESVTGAEVILSADRRAAVATARRRGAEVVVLDDALQSNLIPDVQLAIVLDRDLVRPPRCLPAGPAREGQGALARADALLVRVEGDPWPVTAPQGDRYDRAAAAACGGRAFAFRLAPTTLIGPDGEPVPRPRRPLLVSGLARPASFETSCRRAGIRATLAVRFQDHWAPTPAHEERLRDLVRTRGIDLVVGPEKNLARLAGLDLGCPVAALRARLEWAEDPFPRLIRGLRA